MLNKTVNRRHLLQGLGTGAMGMGFGTGALLPNLAHAITPQNSHSELQNPIEDIAQNGLLDTKVYPQYGEFYLGSKRVNLRCYNGRPVGNTWRIKAGDTIRLSLINRLPYSPDEPECDVMPDDLMNKPRGFNITNMHVHGVHVSPKSPADNIFLMVGYQQSEHYIYDIPADHPPGTYFYHAHFHGSVALQIASGMSGALIIEGEIDTIPEIAAAEEKIMCFQTQRFDEKGLCENYDLLTMVNQPTYINGQLRPTITIKSGEVQHWRMVNASHMVNMQLWVEHHPMTVLSLDGNPLSHTREQDAVIMVPGNRADILIQGGKPGTYAIYNDPTREDTNLVGYLVVKESNEKPMPVFSGTLPRPSSLDDIKADQVTFGRRLEFGYSGEPGMPKYLINGKPFSCHHAWEIPLNNIEEWEVYNHTAESHPFHIHTNPFQMVSGGGVPPGTWLDVVNLAPFERFTFRTHFRDFTGKMVFHCHNLVHEDMGMMQALNIVES